MSDVNINKIIETTIENKMNDLISSLNLNKSSLNTNTKVERDFTNFTIIDIYKNTIQTIIDIINETMVIIDNSSSYSSNYFTNIILIFFKEYRMFYVGIILIILSFVIYFIDD